MGWGSCPLTTGTRVWKRCGPSIPGCIIMSRRMVVSAPGFSVVEPTTGLGGQQPSRTFIDTLPRRSVSWPMLRSRNTWVTSVSSGIRPKSTLC